MPPEPASPSDPSADPALGGPARSGAEVPGSAVEEAAGPPRAKVNVLLIGGGGREHALAWKLSQSPRLGSLYTSHPENPGIAALAQPIDCPYDHKQTFRMQLFCERNDIGLVVVGPEEPLAAGLADALEAPGRLVFGPSKDAARLEADKAWARQMLRAASVPMAEGRAFKDPDAAKTYLSARDEPQVIKAAGLAAGKGVIVPSDLAEGLAAIDRIMVDRAFGDAGSTVVVEERLVGREASVLALVDGRTIYVLEPCEDHKRLLDGDAGPNTGGMGAFCPGGITDETILREIERDILVPAVDVLNREGIAYRGVLYAGVMLTHAGPKLLEFNVRFGDPECQALMRRFDADLVDAMMATCQRRLEHLDVRWSPGASCCIVLASEGYPAKPRTGDVIEGVEHASKQPGVVVFHAGTRRDDRGRLITAGGRVLNVTAVGESLAQARERAYAAAGQIRFAGRQMRTDIGARD